VAVSYSGSGVVLVVKAGVYVIIITGSLDGYGGNIRVSYDWD
jgi:hypothetical protein